MHTEHFRPITREMACEILAISEGTLDKLVAEGILPPPVALGNSRRVYWHPDRFYDALRDALNADANLSNPKNDSASHGAKFPTKAKRSTKRRNDKLQELNS